jgi:hypothetical protein
VLAYDPGANRVYVAAESGWVSIFDHAQGHLTLRGSAHLANGAHSIALDPTTHHSYIPIPQGSQRFTRVAGVQTHLRCPLRVPNDLRLTAPLQREQVTTSKVRGGWAGARPTADNAALDACSLGFLLASTRPPSKRWDRATGGQRFSPA